MVTTPPTAWSLCSTPSDKERHVAHSRTTSRVVLALGICLAQLVPASASDDFLNRDGVHSAYPYGYSDGGVEEPDEEPDRWDLGGPFPLQITDPGLQTLVFG